MQFRNILCTTAIFAAATMVSLHSTTADAQEKVRWRLQSYYTLSTDVIGPNGERVTENVRDMTDGNFDIKFFEPGALIPGPSVFDAVSSGSIDAAYSAGSIHADKEPALAFFTNVPFGPDMLQLQAWIYHGGGIELYDEIWGRFNIKALPCGAVVPEGAGWFHKEIDNVSDVSGLKMRALALGGRVWDKLGASTQLIPGNEIYQALERGAIDAAELSFPSMDVNFGFADVADHYYFPGWQQPAAMMAYIINMDKWNALPAHFQKTLEIACREAMVWSYAIADAKQVDALETLREKGAELHKWSPEMMEAFKSGWDEVVAEESAKNETFKKVFESQQNFRDRYSEWKELAYE